MYFSHLGMSLKIPSLQRCSFCTCKHSWTAISTSSLQWKWPPPKCCATCRSSETRSPTSVAFTYILTVLSHLLPTSCMSIQPFSNLLHHFLTNCTLIRPTTHAYQLAVNFNARNTFYPQKKNRPCNQLSYLPLSQPLYIKLWHKQHLTDWHLCHLLHVTATKSATSSWEIKSLIDTKVMIQGTLLTEHALLQ